MPKQSNENFSEEILKSLPWNDTRLLKNKLSPKSKESLFHTVELTYYLDVLSKALNVNLLDQTIKNEILSFKDSIGNSLLHMAANKGHTAFITNFITKVLTSVPPEISKKLLLGKNHLGFNPLHMAYFMNDTVTANTILQSVSPELAKKLLRAKDKDGNPPLWYLNLENAKSQTTALENVVVILNAIKFDQTLTPELLQAKNQYNDSLEQHLNNAGKPSPKIAPSLTSHQGPLFSKHEQQDAKDPRLLILDLCKNLENPEKVHGILGELEKSAQDTPQKTLSDITNRTPNQHI